MERRRSHRFKTQFDALYSAGSHEGAGVLGEISFTGARIDNASPPIPSAGTRVKLYIFIQPVAPFEVAGHVARCDESSFAIHYDLFDAEIRRLVEDVAAIVATRAA